MPRRRSVTPSRVPSIPWWLEEGEEDCSCGSTYVLELELRCADCDVPMCVHCVRIYQSRRLCSDCMPSGVS